MKDFKKEEKPRVRITLNIEKMALDPDFEINTVKDFKKFQRLLGHKLSYYNLFEFEIIGRRWIDEEFVKAIKGALEILTDREVCTATLKINRRKTVLYIYME